MSVFIRKLSTVFSVTITVVLMLSSQIAMAQGNSAGKGNGNNKNIGVGNASDGIMGSLITDRGIFYTGDSLEISLRFARGAERITAGEVDAYVVIFSPDVSEEDDSSDGADDESSDDGSSDGGLTDAIVLPVSDIASEEQQKLFELEAVDLSTLSAGTYQLGLILTNPDGDPLDINDWYNGLLGLIDIKGVTITDEAVEFDADGDGNVDDDADGDGFSDVVDNDTDE